MRVDKEIRKVEIGEGKRMESFTRGEIDIRDSDVRRPEETCFGEGRAC